MGSFGGLGWCAIGFGSRFTLGCSKVGSYSGGEGGFSVGWFVGVFWMEGAAGVLLS